MIGIPELLVFLIALVVLVPASLVYFLPAVIAFRRHTSEAWWIAGLNVALGCTIAGWVVALVWACRADETDQRRFETTARLRSAPGDDRKPELRR